MQETKRVMRRRTLEKNSREKNEKAKNMLLAFLFAGYYKTTGDY